jgi:hypothetical protein
VRILYDLTCPSIKALRPISLGRDGYGNPNSLCNVRALRLVHSYANPGSPRVINLVQDFGLTLIFISMVRLHSPISGRHA